MLDIILAGAGIAMIVSYLSARGDAAEASEPTSEASSSSSTVAGESESTPPATDGVKTAAGGKSAVTSKGSKAAGASGKSGKTNATGTPETPGDKPDKGKGNDKPDPPPDKPKDKPDVDKPPDKPDEPPDKPDNTNTGDPPPDPPPVSPDAGPGEPTEDEVSVFAGRIDGVVARNQGALTRCYQQAAKTSNPDDPLTGRVDVRFRIMPDESVSGVKVVANTTKSDVLANCLVQHVRSWRFPNGPSQPLPFVWPFAFRAK